MTNEELRRLATEATPGPWAKHSNTDGWSASHDGIGSSEYRPVHGASGEVIALIVAESSEHWVDLDTKSNTDYIAAASPDVVLALLADLDALRTLITKLHAAKGRYHTQLAACDLFDAVGLKNERPLK